jgi:hypothetical protein
MSTATLNIWITEFGDACHIMKPHFPDGKLEEWFVHITDCHGDPLVWCGKRYTFLPTKCGHLEIEIPPGCYTVFASHTPANKVWVPPYGNRLTHVQVVRANCGDHVCVTLFSPTLWYCGTWFHQAINTQLEGLAQVKGLDANVARTTATAVQNFLKQLPPDPYAENTLWAAGAPPK